MADYLRFEDIQVLFIVGCSFKVGPRPQYTAYNGQHRHKQTYSVAA